MTALLKYREGLGVGEENSVISVYVWGDVIISNI